MLNIENSIVNNICNEIQLNQILYQNIPVHKEETNNVKLQKYCKEKS